MTPDPPCSVVDASATVAFVTATAVGAPYELPRCSVVRFKEPTVWEQLKHYVAGAVTLIVIQTALIGWMRVERDSPSRRPSSG